MSPKKHRQFTGIRHYLLVAIFVIAAVLLSLLMPAPLPAQQNQPTCEGPFLPVATPLIDLGSAPYVRMDGQQSEAA